MVKAFQSRSKTVKGSKSRHRPLTFISKIRVGGLGLIEFGLIIRTFARLSCCEWETEDQTNGFINTRVANIGASYLHGHSAQT